MKKTGWMCSALWFAAVAGCAPYPLYRSHPHPPAQPAASPETSLERPEVPLSGEGAEKLEAETGQDSALAALEIPPPRVRVTDPAKISTANAYQVGRASYYGKRFHGRKTAKGDTFDMREMTAAHRVLPLGTIIKVTNLENGRSVEVEVNDRGPFSRRRVLDVSLEAARQLDMVRKGSAKVMIELVSSVK